MSDNLKIIEETIDVVLNENGAPGSILALNHKGFAKEVLKKAGKYTGFYFIAKKTATSNISGTLNFNSNPFNNVSDFTITLSKLTSDLMDIGIFLNQLNENDIIYFKDYVGRVGSFYYQSHTSGTDGSGQMIYNVVVKGDASNINYVYQTNESQICGLSFHKNSSSGPGGGGEYTIEIVANVLNLLKDGVIVDSEDLSIYIDDTNLARIVSGTLNSSTGIATFTRDDTSTFTIDLSSLMEVQPDWNQATPSALDFIKNKPTSLSDFDNDLDQTIYVTEASQIVNQVLDSTKLYKIIGFVPITQTIIVPAGGLTLKGDGFNLCGLTSSTPSLKMFTSPVGGSGDLVIGEITLTSSGTSSQVFDIIDSNGTHAIELEYLNFVGCKSLGKQRNYRQGTWTTIGVYSCDDGLQISGTWTGYKVSNSNCFGFASTGTLFKKDTDTLFSNRLFINVNIDFVTGAKLSDFQSSNFSLPELFQINSSIAKLNGIININNAPALIPNISANNEKCLWVGNIGIPDTADEKFIENVNIGSAYAVNWLYNTFLLTMTQNCVLSETNLPTSGKNSEEIKIYLTTNGFTLTLPSGWNTNKVGTIKSGEINEILIKYLKTGVYFVKINNSLTQYPSPSLKNTVPASILPSATSELILNGSFFTPATIVSIEGQTVNSVEFIDSGQLKLSVTTGATESEYDITISNGASVTFVDALIVNLGDVFIPTLADWTVNSGTPNLNSDGRVQLTVWQSICEATWNQVLDYTQDFIVRFSLQKSSLGNPSGSNENLFYHVRLLKASDNTDLFRFNGRDTSALNLAISSIADASTNLTASSIPSAAFWASNNDLIEFRFISGIMYGYYNGVLKKTFTDSVVGNMKLFVKIRSYNIVNIKYIELI